MVLDQDFREFIELLNKNEVRYLIVGGYAVGFHGYPRYTKDLDVWVAVDPENAKKIKRALDEFGFAESGLSESDFLTPDEFIQLGYPPVRIDIATGCEGLDFATCFELKDTVDIDGIQVNFIDLENLITNKRALGRPQDIADISNLKSKS
jgi:predicted nucleotidyltransferase